MVRAAFYIRISDKDVDRNELEGRITEVCTKARLANIQIVRYLVEFDDNECMQRKGLVNLLAGLEHKEYEAVIVDDLESINFDDTMVDAYIDQVQKRGGLFMEYEELSGPGCFCAYPNMEERLKDMKFDAIHVEYIDGFMNRGEEPVGGKLEHESLTEVLGMPVDMTVGEVLKLVESAAAEMTTGIIADMIMGKNK